MNKLFNPYNLDEAKARIENIINMEISDIKESDRLPSTDDLNSQSVRNANGSVVCLKFTIGFIDVVKKMKLMRLAASEFYNILVSHKGVRDIQFIDDTLVALYDTPLKNDIDQLLEMAAKITAVTSFFNYQISKPSNDVVLKVRVAMHYSSLYVCRKGISSVDNDSIVFSGPEVSNTLKMVYDSMVPTANTIYVTDIFYHNLKKEYQEFFIKTENVYKASVVNTAISDWITKE